MTESTSLETLANDPTALGLDWLDGRRRNAATTFSELGLPTRKHEDWKYTDLRSLTKGTYTIAGDTSNQAIDWDAQWLEEATTRLAFVNGSFDANCSTTCPSGPMVAQSLRHLNEVDQRVIDHLASIATFEDEAITALNTAMFTDAAVVLVDDNHVCEAPIHIVHVLTEHAGPAVCAPRTLIVAGSSAQVTVVESYVSPDGNVDLVCPVTEVVVGSGSTVRTYRDVREGSATVHLARTHVRQADRTHSVTTALNAGGDIVRNGIYATLDGSGSNAEMLGLTMARGQEHVDNFLRVDHAKEHCDSREFFKSVLDDHSSSAFCGRIIVREGAQKTDAKQTNMNLLLSPDASVDTRPQLEIFADDVKCTHGATVGQIEDEAIFYLQARGLDEATARSMLVYAFANECLDHVTIESLRSRHEAILLDRIPNGHCLLSDA